MYRGCIFDLDGTLLNTLEGIAYTTNMALASFGLAPFETERYKLFVGDGAGKLIERVLLERGDKDLLLYDEVLAAYHKFFKVHCLHRVEPYEGIMDLIHLLKQQGVKIAVVSNKPHERVLQNIEAIFGLDVFDHLQGEKTGVNRKPDPAAVFETLEALGLKKEECLYVGDTNTDMMTGKNAGLTTAGVTWGFRLEEELRSYDPAYIVHHPREIGDIIKKS